ncbi:hypothetical protein O0L34_g13769 [Tuta absoluta]|nr:hypothetical protein O0L34_g13769 [Tuta absoluta]
MGAKFGFLLLLATLGSIEAKVGITGSPENVQVTWENKIENTFNDITITQGSTTIYKADAKSLDSPSIKLPEYTVTCKPSTETVPGQCTIIVNPVIITQENANHKYGATVQWTNKMSEISSESADAKNICVKGNAKTPKIIETKNSDGSVDLTCSSEGVPKPMLTWTDKAGKTVTGTPSNGGQWNNITHRFVSASIYRVSEIRDFFNFTCTASQVVSDECKYDAGATKDNFKKENKPEIEAKKNAGNKTTKVTCKTQGLPAPILSFSNGSDSSVDYFKNVKTVSEWDNKTNIFHASIAMDVADNEKQSITCSAKQELGSSKVVEHSKLLQVNSAGKFGVPGVLIATIAAVFFTQSFM